MHYKKMFDDKEHLYAFDLDGREVVAQIEKVIAGEIAGEQGRKSKKPVVSFVGKAKKLALNKTNGKTIASLYGSDTDGWAGKWITMFPTTTNFGGETVECIRVKNQVPQATPRTGGNGSRGGNGRAAAPPAPAKNLTEQIADKMAENAASSEMSEEDRRAIEAAELAEANQ